VGVVRKRARLADVRLHDLRHSFASVAASGGRPCRIIGALWATAKTNDAALRASDGRSAAGGERGDRRDDRPPGLRGLGRWRSVRRAALGSESWGLTADERARLAAAPGRVDAEGWTAFAAAIQESRLKGYARRNDVSSTHGVESGSALAPAVDAIDLTAMMWGARSDHAEGVESRSPRYPTG